MESKFFVNFEKKSLCFFILKNLEIIEKFFLTKIDISKMLTRIDIFRNFWLESIVKTFWRKSRFLENFDQNKDSPKNVDQNRDYLRF